MTIGLIGPGRRESVAHRVHDPLLIGSPPISHPPNLGWNKRLEWRHFIIVSAGRAMIGIKVAADACHNAQDRPEMLLAPVCNATGMPAAAGVLDRPIDLRISPISAAAAKNLPAASVIGDSLRRRGAKP